MNGDITHNVSLARRLGFFRAVILPHEWLDIVKHPSLHESSLSLSKKYFDVRGAIKGKQDQRNRFNYHILRIGNEQDDSPKNIGTQIKEGFINPPPLNSLSSFQRSFKGDIRRIITDTIINDRDVYDNLAKVNGKSNADLDDDLDTESEDEDADVEATIEKHATPPTVSKKRKPTTAPSADSATSESIRSMSAYPSKKFHLVEKAIESPVHLIKSELRNRDSMNRLCTQANSLMQEMNSDGEVCLKYKDMRNGKETYFVKVTSAESHETFRKYSKWLKQALNRNGGKGGISAGAKRATKWLYTNQREAFFDALSELGVSLPQKMNAVQIAAMFKSGNVTAREQRRMILRHLRHHFGKGLFEPEYKVQMLCDGHTEVMADSIEYAYEEGELTVTITYSYKNVANESISQLTRHLQALDITPHMVERIDIINGGDHGIGAFIAGARIVVTLNESIEEEGSDIVPICFEISVAEIICKKDNAEILTKTIRTNLTEGLKTLSERDIVLGMNQSNKIVCSFQQTNESIIGDVQSKSLRAVLYVVGDLAYYGMVLGKEGMSGKWCHLCKLSGKEFSDLSKIGDEWKMEDMKSLANEYCKKVEEKKMNPKNVEPRPTMGMKEQPWWDFIPPNHFIVPLLHCLIGIGGDVFKLFRSIISEDIEYLSKEELDMRQAKGSMEEKIETSVMEREVFDLSADGLNLRKLKSKLTRATKSLNKLGVFGSVAGAASTATNSPNQEFLDSVIDFINDDEAGRNDITNDSSTTNDNLHDNDIVMETFPPAPTDNIGPVLVEELTDVQISINAVYDIIKQSMRDIDPLKKKRARITNRLKNARAYLKKIKDEIVAYQSCRRRSGDGIEAEMFKILKVKYGIKLQAYHGGSMTGKDIQKVMENASEIFPLFANILMANKRPDSKFSTQDEIDDLCNSFKNAFILWDGAFSFASKISPSEDNVQQYSRFSTVAVYSHVSLGCNVTPKVHMMWKHVKDQMMKVPGGLGQKREDWIEHHHQITSKERAQFGKTQDEDVRANAMARLHQQHTDPDVVSFTNAVNDAAQKGKRKGHASRDHMRHNQRMNNRWAALAVWENENLASELGALI